jgi:hypothetical protein
MQIVLTTSKMTNFAFAKFLTALLIWLLCLEIEFTAYTTRFSKNRVYQ